MPTSKFFTALFFRILPLKYYRWKMQWKNVHSGLNELKLKSYEKVNLRLILYGLEYDKLEKYFILFKVKYTEQKAIIDVH